MNSKKVLPHRAKPRGKKGHVQFVNKPKEELKVSNCKTTQDKQFSHLITTAAFTCTAATHVSTTPGSITSSHFSMPNTMVTSTCNVTTDGQSRLSTSGKSMAASKTAPEVKQFQSHPATSSLSVPQHLYHPTGGTLTQQQQQHQQQPYYMPTYQHYPPVHLGYPYPYHPYRYSPVPVYVADVTRRYNELYGHPSSIGGSVYNGLQYQQRFVGIPQVCDASTQSSSQVASANGDGVGSKVPFEGVKEDTQDVMVVPEGKTGKETDEVVTNNKQLVIVRKLVDMLKKKLEGTYSICVCKMLMEMHHICPNRIFVT